MLKKLWVHPGSINDSFNALEKIGGNLVFVCFVIRSSSEGLKLCDKLPIFPLQVLSFPVWGIDLAGKYMHMLAFHLYTAVQLHF